MSSIVTNSTSSSKKAQNSGIRLLSPKVEITEGTHSHIWAEEAPCYKNCFFFIDNADDVPKDVEDRWDGYMLRLAMPWLYYNIEYHRYPATGECFTAVSQLIARTTQWNPNPDEKLPFQRLNGVVLPLPNCGEEGYTCSKALKIPNDIKDEFKVASHGILSFWEEEFAYEEQFPEAKSVLYTLAETDPSPFEYRHNDYDDDDEYEDDEYAFSIKPYLYWEKNFNTKSILNAKFLQEPTWVNIKVDLKRASEGLKKASV